MKSCKHCTKHVFHGKHDICLYHEFKIIDVTKAQNCSGYTTSNLEEKPEQFPQTKSFPNGFTSWMETHYEVVSFLTLAEENDGIEFHARVAQGTGGMYELAEELTDKFEALNKDREWDGEFFEEIEAFLVKETI